MAAVRELFVTPVYQGELASARAMAGLLPELLRTCAAIAQEDHAGRAWCEENGYAGYTSYASLDDLPRRASVFDELRRRLDRHVRRFADRLALDLGPRGRLRMDSLWINVLQPGGAHGGHVHPHSVVSGVVHLHTPPGAGALRLEDPRLPQMMAAPPRRADAPEPLKCFVSIEPRPGGLVLWESFVRHEVLPGRASGERVSLSFNYAWR